MDGIPVSGLTELENHMQQLIEAPNTQVNTKLFDDIELQLTGWFFHSSTTTNNRRGYYGNCYISCLSLRLRLLRVAVFPHVNVYHDVASYSFHI